MLDDDEIAQMKKQIDKEMAEGDIPDPEEEEEKEKEKLSMANQPPAPTPVTVVPGADNPSEMERQKGAEDAKKKKEKKEGYIPTNGDELTEELTRYMAKLNEQD